MTASDEILIGKGGERQRLLLARANRHGLIAGATGTGKTVSLQVLAEGFSARGVPVFMADIKGDLSGMSQPGSPHPKIDERIRTIGIENYSQHGFPVVFWDLYGEQGHPVRTTISEMGPVLLARLLELNDTQEGVLNIAFRIADDQGLLLLDLKDLRAILQFVAASAKEISVEYGNVSKASVGAIARRLLTLENQGGEHFFGEPALELSDLMRTDLEGRGHINLLAGSRLMQQPQLYATFLLWLLAELFEELPEVGDPDKPKLVFFFDEAHLLFDDAPKALLDKVEQVVRLIRSKGVGVYFISQNPMDIPEDVLGQLGNRIQHALRAFTPKDRKAVRAAAETFRPNPEFDSAEAITELGVGEALVSTLDLKGTPSIVDRTLICPPASRLGPATDAERAAVIAASALGRRYTEGVDRESAFEKLKARSEAAASAQAESAAREARAAEEESARRARERESERAAPAARGSSASGRRSSRQGIMESMAKSVVRSIGSSLGRQLVRGLLGSLLKR